jgi:hypothetical protein
VCSPETFDSIYTPQCGKGKKKMPLNIKKFRKKKKTLDEESVKLILEVYKEQNLGARRMERIIDFTYGKHIPHNAIHKELLSHGLANLVVYALH